MIVVGNMVNSLDISEFTISPETRIIMVSHAGNPGSIPGWKTIDPKGFNSIWKRIRKKAGITIRFRDLRHTYASYLASSGKVDIYTLKELLGHSDIKMTQRYAHLINRALRKTANVVDEVF